jgi:hypothetical protein
MMTDLAQWTEYMVIAQEVMGSIPTQSTREFCVHELAFGLGVLCLICIYLQKMDISVLSLSSIDVVKGV